jgi:putative oxidoreductase
MERVMSDPFAPNPEGGLTLLRITFGLMTFMHGRLKLGHIAEFAEAWGLPTIIARLVMGVQLVGGICICIGVLTRPAAALQVAVNFVVLVLLIFKAREPFLAPARHSWSIGLVYLVMALVVLIGGSGRFALESAFPR